MDLQQLLAAILNPNGSQQAQPQMAGLPSPVGDHNNPALLRQAQQGLAQPPQMAAPQMQARPQMPPQAPQGQPMPQNAPQAPAGGGLGALGGILQNIIAPQSAAKNKTVGWLTSQGLDPGTATILASDKTALRQYIMARSQGKQPIEIAGKLVDPNTYEVLADFSDKSAQGFTLGEGQVRYDAQGNKIAEGGPKAASTPAGIQEYEYAKAQGFPGTFTDWEASKRGGMSLQVDPTTGAVTFQQGGNIKPLTESQSKDTVYSTRAAGALPLIDQYGEALTSLPESMAGNVPGVGNYMKSREFQQAEQAGKEFLQAILRKDTGAAIHQHEMESYGSVYLPRPGDTPEVLSQKKASRARALEAIKAGMPAQAILAQERALAAGGTDASGSKAPPTVGETRYGYRFKGGDPSEPSSWEKAN